MTIEIKTTQQKRQHIIDEMMGDFACYQHPGLLKKEYVPLLDISKANLFGIKKYTELFANTRYAWQKTLKYKYYFESFYPPAEKVEKIEALNHHIHAYLQDITILKNKIEVLLGEMKNDIKKVALNKNDIDAFFKAGVEKTAKVVLGVSEPRHKHHHHGMRFFDGDLLKAENAREFLKMLSNPTLNAMLNQAHKPKMIERFTKEREESFEMAKKRWIETAQKNDERTTRYLQSVLKIVRPLFYRFLNIKPIYEIIVTTEKQSSE